MQSILTILLTCVYAFRLGLYRALFVSLTLLLSACSTLKQSQDQLPVDALVVSSSDTANMGFEGVLASASASSNFDSTSVDLPAVEAPLIDDSVDTHSINQALSTAVVSSMKSASLDNELSSQYECASSLALDKRVGQLLFPLITQGEFTKATRLASSGLLGGVVVLGSPNASIREDIAKFQKQSFFGPGIIAVDEEGGRVQRLSKLTSLVPSARKVALSLDLDQARELAERHAIAIGQLGFTMNLAPVADLDFGKAIGDRSFGRDASTVSAFALATADGIINAGLVPVLKHFPGHGRGSDSHYGLPVIPPIDVLRNRDLVPFIEASKRRDIPIMVGHLVVEGLTDGQPASVSNAAIEGLLRTELGFDGLVMTDAFNMEAISASMSDAEAATLALAAGVDLVMLSSLSDTLPVLEQVVDSVTSGLIQESSITESFVRVMHTRSLDVCSTLNLL